MSSSFSRLSTSVRSLSTSVSSSSSSVTTRIYATHSRRYSFAAMKQKSPGMSPTSRKKATSRTEPRAVYADAAEEDQRGHGIGTVKQRQFGATVDERRPLQAFGQDRRIPRRVSSDKINRFQDWVDYSAMRTPSPLFAEHLNNLFPELQFPDELARRILTHSSHPAAVYGHNAALSFMGRRVISAYLSLLLSSSPNLKLSDDVEAIVTEALNTYVLGEHIGSKWGLGRVMRWTPTLKADSAKNANIELLASVGLYKVQGDAVAAVIGGIYEHFGASTAHRVFYTRVLPHILINKPKSGLPEAFHSDARSVCNRFGGMSGPLVVDHSSLPPLPTEARKTQSVAPEPSAVPSLD